MDGAKPQVDLMIVGGLVVTVDERDRVIKGGAIAIRGDRICAVGTEAEVTSTFVARRTIMATDKLVMPGLIDTYFHAGHSMIKGIWRPGLGWPASEVFFHGTTPDWWYAEGLLSALERVKFGVTTGVSILGATPARCDDPVFAERHAEAAAQVGIRTFLGVGPPDPFLNNPAEPWSGSFFDTGTPVRKRFTHEDTILVVRYLIAKLRASGSGRVTPILAIPYLCGLNPEYMTGYHRYLYSRDDTRLLLRRSREARELADEYGVLIHTHSARGALEWAETNFGPHALRELLGGDVIFAHANGLTEREIAIMAETGCGAAAVPFASWNTTLGACPLVRLIREGVRVAIATDGAAPFHVSDLFVDLHRAMFLQWMENRDMSVLPSGKAIRLVTAEAAGLLGVEAEIGSLSAGKKADMILIDLDQPHLVPFEDPANMIAFYVRGNDVDSVIIDGQIVMEGRKVNTVDEADVIRRAREEIAKAFERVDVSRYLHRDPSHWRSWQETL